MYDTTYDTPITTRLSSSPRATFSAAFRFFFLLLKQHGNKSSPTTPTPFAFPPSVALRLPSSVLTSAQRERCRARLGAELLLLWDWRGGGGGTGAARWWRGGATGQERGEEPPAKSARRPLSLGISAFRRSRVEDWTRSCSPGAAFAGFPIICPGAGEVLSVLKFAILAQESCRPWCLVEE